jgi:hypothetical protein
MGGLLAFSATLVIPPLPGAAAIALGWTAYAHGQGKQRRQGVLVMAGGVAGIALGLAFGFWAQETGFLGP